MRKADRRAACQRPWARFGPGGTSPHSPAGLRRSPPQPPFTIRSQCGRLSGGSRLAAELSVVGCNCAAMLCTCDMTAMMPAFGSPPETAVKCVRVFQCVYRSPSSSTRFRRTGTRTAPPRRGPCVSFYSGSPRPCPVFSSYRYENTPGGANDNCVNRFVSLTLEACLRHHSGRLHRPRRLGKGGAGTPHQHRRPSPMRRRMRRATHLRPPSRHHHRPRAAFTPHPSLGSAALADPCDSSHVS